MAGVKPNDNMAAFKVALDEFGAAFGLDRAHRLAQFLPQAMHESGNFRYDTEVWGPTPAQQRYEDRKDLGHSPAVDGEAEKFKGRTGFQATGRANYAKFRDWCRKQGYNPPDFEKNPELINTNPWEGLFPIYYWAVGNPTGKSLNRYADEGDIEQITKKINGGLNGFDDRLEKYTRVALVLLGYEPTEVKAFQRWAQRNGLLPNDEPGKPPQVDGDVGPKTRSALHMALVQMDGARSVQSPQVKAAPVVEEVTVEVTKEVAVAPPAAEKRGSTWIASAVALAVPQMGTFFATDLVSKLLILGVSVVAIGFIVWRAEAIAKAIKTLREQLG